MRECIDLLSHFVRREIFSEMVHLVKVLRSNTSNLLLNSPRSPGGLLLVASRINHSCVPNAYHTYHGTSLSKSFFALCDIAAHEEKTFFFIHYARLLRAASKGFELMGLHLPVSSMRSPASGQLFTRAASSAP